MLRPSLQQEWRPVVGYEGLYSVSLDGRVSRVAEPQRGRDPGYCLRPFEKKSTGYLAVSLCKNGDFEQWLLHRIVAEAFLGPAPAAGYVVHHQDGDRTNNHAGNLEWITVSANTWQAYIAQGCRQWGAPPPVLRGEAANGAKLTEKAVREIRSLYRSLGPSLLAQRFGVSVSTVRLAAHGITWAHVEG